MVSSILKAIKILEALSGNESLGVTELSNRLGFPKSSVHSILETLESESLLEKKVETGKYHLGLKLVEFGNRAQVNLDICKIAHPYLKELNRLTDETVHLTVLDNDEVLYVDCIESKQWLRTYSVIGVRAPLYCTAVGKAIMANLDYNHVKRIIKENGLPRITENTITTEDALFAELEDIRIKEYAIDNMEHEDRLICIGAPIRNAKGEVFASISVSGPVSRQDMSTIDELGKRVMEATREISWKLGYRTGP
jgi:IclR family transcriptional regulator, KDG regulon repressor